MAEEDKDRLQGNGQEVPLQKHMHFYSLSIYGSKLERFELNRITPSGDDEFKGCIIVIHRKGKSKQSMPTGHKDRHCKAG